MLVRKSFTGAMLEPSVKQTMAKYIDADALRARLAIVKEKWPQIQERCRAQVMPAVDVESILRQVGAVYHPGQIGLTESASTRPITVRASSAAATPCSTSCSRPACCTMWRSRSSSRQVAWAERPWGGQKYWNL